MIYARKGEVVFCEAGHRAATVARDITAGELLQPDALDGVVLTGDKNIMPKCPRCGARIGVGYWRGDFPVDGGFFFERGFRMSDGKTIRHLKRPPESVPA